MTLLKKHVTHLLSFALCLVLCFSIYSIYDCFFTRQGIWVGIATVLTALAYFVLCYFTERHKLVGGIAIVSCMILSIYIYQYASGHPLYWSVWSFLQWLLTKGGEGSEGGTFHLWTTYIFFTTFFSVTIYYFSNVLYRMFFLTMLSLIPGVLYLKVLSEMNNYFLVIIVLFNITIFIMNRKRNFQFGTHVRFGNTLISSGSFVLLLLLCTAAIPKNTDTPYYDVFEDAFLGGDTTSPLADSFSELSAFSNDAGGFWSGLGNDNRKLYTIRLNRNPDKVYIYYLKRQNFDLFDFSKKKWYADDFYNKAELAAESYETQQSKLNLPDLQGALLATEGYEPGFLEQYGLSAVPGAVPPKEERLSNYMYLNVNSENFGAIFYLAPTRGCAVTVDGEEPYYATANGTFRSEKNVHPENFFYQITYNAEPYLDLWLDSGAGNIKQARYETMLSHMRRILADHNDPYEETAISFMALDSAAQKYHMVCAENTDLISPEICALAAQITRGKKYDYQKADALVAYFEENEFVYDLDFRTLDKSPENFLFNTKRGTCSDYATAFTLLARAAGLTVRYAEGYVTEPENIYTYVVKSRDSHAYPEVYLPTLGWVVYEPTVSRMDSMTHHFSLSQFITNLRMDYGLMGVITCFILLGMLLITIIRVFLPLFLEMCFRIRLCTLASSADCALLAYNRLVRKAVRWCDPQADSKTPYELACFLQSIGCDISSLSFLLEDYLYGDKAPLPQAKAMIRKSYRKASRALSKMRRQRIRQQKKVTLPPSVRKVRK